MQAFFCVNGPYVTSTLSESCVSDPHAYFSRRIPQVSVLLCYVST